MEKRFLHTRACVNGYPDEKYFPRLELADDSMLNFNLLRYSEYLKVCDSDLNKLCLTPIESKKIDDAFQINWVDRPVKDWCEENYEKFSREQNREFKNIFSIFQIAHRDYPDKAVDGKLFKAILTEYLHNLVFTKWLYHDFISYKHYVKDQKKKKRQNYKKNLHERKLELREQNESLEDYWIY